MITYAEALGNRFILVDQRLKSDSSPLPSVSQLAIAAKTQGFPIDQIVYLHPSTNADTDAHLIFYNQDGSLAEACGNGTRCAALWIYQQEGQRVVVFSSAGGVLRLSIALEHITLTLPSPQFIQPAPISPDLPLRHPPVWISLGNPHLVLWMDAPLSVENMQYWGDSFQSAFPQGVNVSFATIAKANINLQVWERGVGLTKACGTGACATHVSGYHLGFLAPSSSIHQQGGVLTVHWDGEGCPLTLMGPAAIHGPVQL